MVCRQGGLIAALLAAMAWGPDVTAQQLQGVAIETIPVAGNVYMLVGRGGNIGLSVGEDGVFLIDDQYAPLTEKILAAVGKVSTKPVRFLLNTHWHADHTGGNENIGKTGAIIVAHRNVRQRLGTDQFIEAFGRRVPASPEAAWPVITFEESVTFHWNGDELQVIHVQPAHTDGDSVIFFRKANVIHTGDVFFNGMYPFIDVSSGGSIDGMITAVDRVLELINETTKIIPGHGPLAGFAELQAYRHMLHTVAARIRPMVAAGKSSAEVIASKPTRGFDEQWGGGFLKPDPWVGIVYNGMVKK